MPNPEDKLKILLEHARETVPYYQTSFSPYKEPLPRDLHAYLEDFPILSRRQVQSQKTRLISTAGNTETWRRTQTSGTSGEPLEVILNHESRIVEASLLAAHIESRLNSNDWRAGKVLHLTLHPGSKSQTLPALWHEAGQISKWNLIMIWQQSDEEFISTLSCINGTVITIMPSVVELLCSRIISANAVGKIQPSLVILSGEAIPKPLRISVERVFGCPVSSLYTMAEVGIVGLESPDQQGYMVAEESAFVEIVDRHGKRLSHGEEGEIVVTALNNLAMPLIRYQTGDRGYWVNTKVLRLVQARKPIHLVSPTGVSINVIRFAKMLASLKVDSYLFSQEPDGKVIFSYSSKDQALDNAGYTLVQSIVRGALGPDTRLQIRRIESVQPPKSQQKQGHSFSSTSTKSETLGPNLDEIANWLQNRLSAETQIEVALLTGSALDPEMITRFSDIDCVIFVKDHPENIHWLDLTRYLKSYIPKLSINIDSLDMLSKRSPLMACRLICEQIPIIGMLDKNNFPWPALEDLRRQGLLWSQGVIATLWLKLVKGNQADNDLLHEAWMDTKIILQALRYYYLAQNERETAGSKILEKVRIDSNIPKSWKSTFLDAVQVSREFKPPPMLGGEAAEHYLQAALSCVRFVQNRLLAFPEY